MNILDEQIETINSGNWENLLENEELNDLVLLFVRTK
jgi:hypothetical protein